MAKINWNEYKEHKQHCTYEDNFEILLDFMKRYYHMNNPMDLYDTFEADDIAKMMLEKRNISDAIDLENFLNKR